MKDIVLDTNILADFLAQYFSDFQVHKRFSPANNTMNAERVRVINKIIKSHEVEQSNFVAASTFAFVEISRKWEIIVKGRFTVEKFSAFVDQPPDWFLIPAVESSLFPEFLEIPANVKMSKGLSKPIEWADAIHLATAMSREYCLLATTDRRIRQVESFKENII